MGTDQQYQEVPDVQRHDGEDGGMQPHDVPMRCALVLDLWEAV
jgi:hypothetical protein